VRRADKLTNFMCCLQILEASIPWSPKGQPRPAPHNTHCLTSIPAALYLTNDHVQLQRCWEKTKKIYC